MTRTISQLANEALIALANKIGHSQISACLPQDPLIESMSHRCGVQGCPLGHYLGQTIITTELATSWELPADEKYLKAALAEPIELLHKDLLTALGYETNRFGESTGYGMELVFAIPALDASAFACAVAYDLEAGVAVRTAIHRSRSLIEIAVNFGVRPALKCRKEN